VDAFAVGPLRGDVFEDLALLGGEVDAQGVALGGDFEDGAADVLLGDGAAEVAAARSQPIPAAFTDRHTPLSL